MGVLRELAYVLLKVVVILGLIILFLWIHYG